MPLALRATLAGLVTTQVLLYATFAAAYWLHDRVWGPLGVAVGVLFGFGALLVGTGTAYHVLRSPNGQWRESAVPVAVAVAGIALGLPIVAYGRALYPIAVCESWPDRLVAHATRCDIVCVDGLSRTATPIARYFASAGKGTHRWHPHLVQALRPVAPDGRFVLWFEGEANDGARCLWRDRVNAADGAARGHRLGHPQAVVGEWVSNAGVAVGWFRTKTAIFLVFVNLAALVAGASLGRKERLGQ